jgi:hypothetical protein
MVGFLFGKALQQFCRRAFLMLLKRSQYLDSSDLNLDCYEEKEITSF